MSFKIGDKVEILPNIPDINDFLSLYIGKTGKIVEKLKYDGVYDVEFEEYLFGSNIWSFTENQFKII